MPSEPHRWIGLEAAMRILTSKDRLSRLLLMNNVEAATMTSTLTTDSIAQRVTRQSRAECGTSVRSAPPARSDLRNGVLAVCDQAIVSGASFATSVIVGRSCAREDMGLFYLVLTVVYLVKGLQEHLICAPYAIYWQTLCGGRRTRYSASTFAQHLALSAATVAIAAAVTGGIAAVSGKSALVLAALPLVGMLPFLQLREFVRRLMLARVRLGAAVGIDTGVAVLQVGGLVYLAYVHRVSVMTAYAVMAVACALVCGAWLLVAREPVRFVWWDAVADWRRNWDFGRWALAGHLIGFATLYMTPWIVTAQRGSADAGVLAACVSIVGIASMFMTGLAGFLVPRAAAAYAEGNVAALRRVLCVATLTYASALGIFAVVVAVRGESLLQLAFGSQYSGVGPVLIALALSMLAQSIGLTAGIGLWAMDRPQANLSADICTLIITLSLVFLLLPSLGVLGAALGDLGGRVGGATVRHGTLRALLKLQPVSVL